MIVVVRYLHKEIYIPLFLLNLLSKRDENVLVQREMEKGQPCYSSLTEVKPHE